MANNTSQSKYVPKDLAGEQVNENEERGMGDSNFQDFSSVRGTAMSDVENASQYDGESVREIFMTVKDRYENLVKYCTGGRQAIIDSMQIKLSRAHMVAMSMQHINPHDRGMLQDLIQEQEASAEEDRAQVQHLDSQVEVERMQMLNDLTGMLHAGPGGTMNSLVREFNWPTLGVCQDLGLPLDYQYMIMGTYNPSTIIRDATGGITVQEGPQDTAETIFLKQRIAMLEAQMQKSNQAKVTTKPEEAMKGQVKKMDPVFLERRRRHKFETFSKGTPYEAQQWVNRYEVLADYLGFTKKEKAEELVAVFGGDTLDWFIGLEPSIKNDWEEIKKAFLHMHAQGSDPTLIAFDELKAYKQGDKLMKTFGPEITSLLQRAGIYQPSIQLDYLKDRLKPELEQAVILRGATTLTEGIKIATEIERSLSRAKKTTYMGPVQQYDQENTVEEQQNYQQEYKGKRHNGGKPRFGGYRRDNKKTEGKDNRECYNCGKRGHIKRDCFAKKEHKQNLQELQEAQVQDEQKDRVQEKEELSDDEDIDIFAHLMHNNNQEVNEDQEARYTKGGERFKIKATSMDGKRQDVLVDTGSTISTVSKATVARLGLQEFACKQQIIRYGNTSTQIAASKAIWEFRFNQGDTSRACLLVVPDQNEELILGMDWLEKEDILLHPKEKSVIKNKIQENNNMELVVQELLNKFPNVTKDDDEQSLTTAPYEHSIDTGNAAPTVTRDFRRSPAENEAIQKEVEMMLKKKVIVPSNSDWCFPVILIDQETGWLFFSMLCRL